MKTFGIRLSAFIIGFVVLSLTGCASTGKNIQVYAGSPRPFNEVVILKLQREPLPVLLQKVDDISILNGRSFIRFNTEEIELLPGRHTLDVWYADGQGRRARHNIKLDLNCELEHEYMLHSAAVHESLGTNFLHRIIGGSSYWTAWVTDTRTGETVAGEPRENPVLWYEH